MVLTYSRTLAFALVSVPSTLTPSVLFAQSLPDVAPALPREDREYETRPRFIGPVAVTLEADARIEYDDNVFALPDDKTDDAIFVASTNTELAIGSGDLTAKLNSMLTARRFAKQSSQDTEAVRFEGSLQWRPRSTETIDLAASWERAIEDRGDPEARQSTVLGPRELDISSVAAAYKRSGGKVQLNLEAELASFNATAPIDDDRDFTVYGGTAKVGVRVGGRVFATASAFASQRDFRLDVGPDGINRDAAIYGARVGVEFAPGGLIEGSVGVGFFQNEPEDPTLSNRSGLSIEGLLIYRPTRRMALLFDASRGDVATFRGGASGRTDTTMRVTWEHEVRHNLYSSVSVGYRESDFSESGIDEQTVIGRGQIEYLVRRNVSLIGQASYGSRDSQLVSEEFDRFRASVGVRVSF